VDPITINTSWVDSGVLFPIRLTNGGDLLWSTKFFKFRLGSYTVSGEDQLLKAVYVRLFLIIEKLIWTLDAAFID